MMTMMMMTMVAVVMTMMLVMTMMMTVLVMTVMHVFHATATTKCPPPLMGKAIRTSNPEVVLLSPRSHIWLEANGFNYSSSPRGKMLAIAPMILPCCLLAIFTAILH